MIAQLKQKPLSRAWEADQVSPTDPGTTPSLALGSLQPAVPAPGIFPACPPHGPLVAELSCRHPECPSSGLNIQTRHSVDQTRKRVFLPLEAKRPSSPRKASLSPFLDSRDDSWFARATWRSHASQATGTRKVGGVRPGNITGGSWGLDGNHQFPLPPLLLTRRVTLSSPPFSDLQSEDHSIYLALLF